MFKYKYNLALYDYVVSGFVQNPDTLAMSLPVQRDGHKDGDHLVQCTLEPRCKTIGCFAGWTSIHNDPEPDFDKKSMYWHQRSWYYVRNNAIMALGSSPYDSKEVRFFETLFYVDRWPTDVKNEYRIAPTAQAKAEAAFKRFAEFREQMIARMDERE